MKDKDHCAFIASLPCIVCSKAGVQVAHVRYAEARAGKTESGMQRKSSDRWTLPLCPQCHEDQHKHGEREWWRKRNLDPVYLAMALWINSGDQEAGENVVRHAYFHS